MREALLTDRLDRPLDVGVEILVLATVCSRPLKSQRTVRSASHWLRTRQFFSKKEVAILLSTFRALVQVAHRPLPFPILEIVEQSPVIRLKAINPVALRLDCSDRERRRLGQTIELLGNRSKPIDGSFKCLHTQCIFIKLDPTDRPPPFAPLNNQSTDSSNNSTIATSPSTKWP
jgi:hypothetical protein